MRIAVLSDVHANYHALTAVLKDIDDRKIDIIWCLGDIIGRGAFPIETARVLWRRYKQQSEQHRLAWLCGNHEMLFFNRIPLGFIHTGSGQGHDTISADNRYAVEVLLSHRQALTDTDANQPLLDWLAALPPFRAGLFGHVFLAHGAYFLMPDGQVDEDSSCRVYLMGGDAVISDMLRRMVEVRGDRGGLVICGHTHASRMAVWDGATQRIAPVTNHDCKGGHRFDLRQQLVYVNAGSVGFPRRVDGYDDQCPTYVLLSGDKHLNEVQIEFIRVPYAGKDVKLPEDYPNAYRDEMHRCNDSPLEDATEAGSYAGDRR